MDAEAELLDELDSDQEQVRADRRGARGRRGATQCFPTHAGAATGAPDACFFLAHWDAAA